MEARCSYCTGVVSRYKTYICYYDKKRQSFYNRPRETFICATCQDILGHPNTSWSYCLTPEFDEEDYLKLQDRMIKGATGSSVFVDHRYKGPADIFICKMGR